MIDVYHGVVPYQRLTYLVLSGYVTSSSLPAGVYCAANDDNITGTSSTGHIPVLNGGGDGDVVIVRYGDYSVVATAAHVIGFATSGGPTNTFGTVTFSMSADSSSEPYGFLIGVGTRDGGSTTVYATLSEGSSVTVSGDYLRTAGSMRAVIVPLRIRKYTVSFDANGGTGAPSSVSVAAGGQWTCPSTIPTKSNSNFAGWATSQSATPQEVAYYPNSSYPAPSANLILYAVWVAEVGVVVYNPMGGTMQETAKTVEVGSAYGTLPTPTLSGWTFTGWFTAETGGTQVTSATVMQSAGNVVIYARWAGPPMTSYVFFDANGGTAAEHALDPRTVAEGAAIGILPTVTRSNWTFARWKNAATGAEITAATAMGTVDVYAVAEWTRSSHTITFDPNGGIVPQDTETVYDGEAFGSLPIPQNDGSNFVGWFTEGGDRVLPSSVPEDDTELRARWTNGTVEWFKASKAVAVAGSL